MHHVQRRQVASVVLDLRSEQLAEAQQQRGVAGDRIEALEQEQSFAVGKRPRQRLRFGLGRGDPAAAPPPPISRTTPPKEAPGSGPLSSNRIMVPA
jgi:hypothetical protein